MLVFTSDCVMCEFNAEWSRLLTSMEGLEGPIPLPNVDSTTLGKLKYWQEMPGVGDIDEQWETLWRMAHAADYLDMPQMMDQTCQALANHLKGKSTVEIQALVNG